MIVFNAGLNSFTDRYLIKRPEEDQVQLAATFTSEYNKCLVQIIEQLLLFDKIAIKVHAENLPLVVLLNELGTKTVLQLVEDGILEFVHWTQTLTMFQQDDYVGKMLPLQSGNYTSSVHIDPVESIKLCFDRMRNPPDRKQRREIERKVAPLYRPLAKKIAEQSIELINGAYNANKLAELGLPNNKSITWLDHDERVRLLGLADSVLETSVLSASQYSSYDNYAYYSIASPGFEQIGKGSAIAGNFQTILTTEKLPDLSLLLAERKIELKDLVRLRNKRVSRQFRKWITEKTNGEDSEYIIGEYINDITNHKGFFETKKGKLIKVFTMFGISTGVGAVTGGAAGSLIGAGAGAVAEKLSDVGLNLLDTYLLDGLLKGWQPKMFFDAYKKVTVNPPE